jgi:GntR family transcriptional regulator
MAQMVGAGLRLGMESLRIESRMPTPAESAELAIPPGTPVFERHRRLWTARPERRPVEVGFQVVPADRVAYLLDVDLEAVQP